MYFNISSSSTSNFLKVVSILIYVYCFSLLTSPHKIGREIRTGDLYFIKSSHNQLNYFLGIFMYIIRYITLNFEKSLYTSLNYRLVNAPLKCQKIDNILKREKKKTI
jgi:hypothetical protein